MEYTVNDKVTEVDAMMDGLLALVILAAFMVLIGVVTALIIRYYLERQLP